MPLKSQISCRKYNFMNIQKNKSVLVTGSAGFIGFHLSQRLLDAGWTVLGFDALTDYYDVELKKNRETILKKNNNFHPIKGHLEDADILFSVFERYRPEVVVHLAAQAGVRYSIVNPRTYLEGNIIGTFELLEAARVFPPQHLLMASTSSVYGSNVKMPYSELDKAEHQMSFYAASKKATENFAHSYAHLFELPVTMFRFFTVYGPYGRPDMALFKFTKAIFEGDPIDVYNFGNMERDFTFIDDLTLAIELLIDKSPADRKRLTKVYDSLSPVAPFQIVNIGNSKPVKLMDYISAIEKITGKTAFKNMMPMQEGDVPATWADVSLLRELTGYAPETDIETGVAEFITWYKEYYKIPI